MTKREKIFLTLTALFMVTVFTGCIPTAAEQSLLDAVSHENSDAVKSIIAGDPKLANAQDKKGNSALHHAIIWGDTDVIKLLIANGADIDAPGVNAPSPGGTPLHYAVIWADKDLVNLLLDNGADINAVDKRGRTPLWTVMHLRAGEKEVAKLLIDRGADVNIIPVEESWTILYAVVEYGWADIAEQLIAKGVDINEKCGRDGRIALHAAARRGQKDMAALLIEKGSEINPLDDAGHTPMYYADKRGYEEIADMLARRGGVK